MPLEQNNRSINMENNLFENEVLEKLSSIEDRLTNIENKFEEATGLADSILSDENSLFGTDGLSSIKDTLAAFMPSQLESNIAESNDIDPDTLQDLVGSLKDFRDRLSGIKTAISDLPEGIAELQNDDRQ